MPTILHLIDTTGPGGAETVFLNLFDAFNRAGFRSVALVGRDGWVAQRLQDRGVTPYVCATKGSLNTAYLREIVRVVRRERVDLLQAHLAGASVYGSMAGTLTRKPVVSLFHGTVDLEGASRLLWAKNAVLRFGSDRIVAVSNGLRGDLLRRLPLRPDRMRVIYNGVDTERFHSAGTGSLREELGLGPDTLLVCSVGNIRTPKGYDHLLEAARRLREQERPVHFAVAGHGKGTLYERLLERRRDWKLEDTVTFLGFRDDTVNILSSSDVFLLPSTSEGFSISTIEAMACGLPVVATRSGGPEEIITPDVDGCLIPPASGESIAAAIRDLAADPDKRRRFGSAARETVARRFSLEAMIEAYRDLYREVLGG